MGIIVTTKIICDGMGCKAHILLEGERARRRGLAKVARKEKWTTYLLRHYCPPCAIRFKEFRRNMTARERALFETNANPR